MGADRSGCLLLLLLLLMGGLSPEVAAEAQEPSDGPGASQEVVWLTDVPAAMEFIATTEVAVIGFFQVCPDTPLAVLPKNQKCSISKAMTVTCWPDDTA